MKLAPIALVSLLFFGSTAVTSAYADNECVQTYYQTKSAPCVDEALAAISTSTPTHKAGVFNPGLIGFFAALFKDNAQEKARLLAKDVAPEVKPFLIEALYVAGLESEAETYAAAIYPNAVASMRAHKLNHLSEIAPMSVPADNDVLIGAYGESGDTDYIKRVLQNYSTASDGMVSDALRLSMMQSKFGPTLAAPGREASVAIKAACEKYDCKKDPHDLLRVMTLSSAFWALSSLGTHDQNIQKTFASFFENDARLKTSYAIESNAFANYVTSLGLYSVVKDNQKVNESLSLYEHLRPVGEINAAMMTK